MLKFSDLLSALGEVSKLEGAAPYREHLKQILGILIESQFPEEKRKILLEHLQRNKGVISNELQENSPAS